MELHFERWNGAGNLLTIVDNMDGRFNAFFTDQEQRHRLVRESGADGLMEIRTPSESKYAYKVVFHDGQGRSGLIPVCGNGSRCTAGYACHYGIVPTSKHNDFLFEAADGSHSASARLNSQTEHHNTTISMAEINHVTKVNNNPNEWFANSGTAHFVKFIPEGTLASIDVAKEGLKLSQEKNHLGEGLSVLVNFVEDRSDGVYARCYASASGFEIMACGSASMAIAVVHAMKAEEKDGAHVKPINWKNAAVTVGYTKTGTRFTANSLSSDVFRETKGTFLVK